MTATTPAQQGRIFAYCRVSTADQTTENQKQEIAAAGFKIDPRRIVTETVSGSMAASQRAGFAKLLDRMESGDTLIVTKLDRLGRDAIDVRQTVDQLDAAGVKVVCLQLGKTDLSSTTGKLIMQVLNAMAEFERDLLRERTNAGLARARSEGKQFGRPPALTEKQRSQVRAKLAAGESVSSIAREYDTTRQTIMRVREAAAAPVPASKPKHSRKPVEMTDLQVRQELEKRGQQRLDRS